MRAHLIHLNRPDMTYPSFSCSYKHSLLRWLMLTWIGNEWARPKRKSNLSSMVQCCAMESTITRQWSQIMLPWSSGELDVSFVTYTVLRNGNYFLLVYREWGPLLNTLYRFVLFTVEFENSAAYLSRFPHRNSQWRQPRHRISSGAPIVPPLHPPIQNRSSWSIISLFSTSYTTLYDSRCPNNIIDTSISAHTFHVGGDGETITRWNGWAIRSSGYYRSHGKVILVCE